MSLAECVQWHDSMLTEAQPVIFTSTALFETKATFSITGDFQLVSPCTDINECDTTDGEFASGQLCDPMAVDGSCANSPGGYNCTACPPGFDWVGTRIVEFDGRNVTAGFDGSGYWPGCSLPPVDPEAGEAAATPQTTLTLSATDDVLVEGSPAQEAFMDTLAADLALSLGIPIEEVEIIGLRASGANIVDMGRRRVQDAISVDFDFMITGDDAASAMTELYAQLSDPESPMMNGEATGQLVPGQTPVVNMVCPKGTYRAEGESSCTSCNGGYEPNDAQDGCLKCVESRGGNGYSGLEFYSAGNLCQLCAPGKVPKQDEFGNKVDCVACDDGLFAPAASDRCSPCPLRQQPNAEKSACACAAGTYNATMGQIMCFEGTSNYEADLFRYPDHDYPTHDGCVPCDETCMDCATGVPLMLPGFAMGEDKALSGLALSEQKGHRPVFACPLQNVSCAGSVNKRPAHNGGDDDWQCRTGSSGPLCQNCDDGYARKGLNAPCFLCNDAPGATGFGFTFVLLAIVFIIVGFMVVLRYIAKTQAGDKEVTGVVAIVNKVMSLAKSCIGLFQVISQLEFTLDLSFPDTFKWFIDVVKIFSLDMLGWLDIGCVTSFTYYVKFTFGILLPAMLLIGCAISYAIITRKKNVAAATHEKGVATQMAFIVIFLLYPMTSQTIFQGFSCRQLGRDEEWLSADYQLACNSYGYVFFQIWGVMATLIWPVGIPVATLWALLKNKNDMRVKNSPQRRKFAFIVGDYKPTYYYWECLEMLRKVSITGLLIFVRKGSVLQVVVAVLISFGFMIAHARSMPYRDDLANKFKLATECSLVLTLIFSILLKIDLSKEDITSEHVGVMLLFVNVVIPAGQLTLGICKEARMLKKGDTDELSDLDRGFTSVYEEPIVETESELGEQRFSNPMNNELSMDSYGGETSPDLKEESDTAPNFVDMHDEDDAAPAVFSDTEVSTHEAAAARTFALETRKRERDREERLSEIDELKKTALDKELKKLDLETTGTDGEKKQRLVDLLGPE